MNKLFIDTNVFYKMGYNFDDKNPIIYMLLKNAKEKIFRYYNLSIIDNEIIEDLKERGNKNFKKIKSLKWIREYIDEETIKKNCCKDLIDYTNFKTKIKAINCTVDNINPEVILKKYFNIMYPFEKEKRKEFPDAFIAEYINSLQLNDKEKIYFISEDKGLISALKKHIIIYNSLEKFLSDLNKISPCKFKKIDEFIKDNFDIIENGIMEKANIMATDLENEDIDIETISVNGISNIDVIDNNNGLYYINCMTDYISLNGQFSCLDYNNSYMPNDCDFYALEEYLSTNRIDIENYEFYITLKEENDNFKIIFPDQYNISIDYNLMQESLYNNYEWEEGSLDGDFR